MNLPVVLPAQMQAALAVKKHPTLWAELMRIANSPADSAFELTDEINTLVDVGLLTSRSIYRHPNSPLAVVTTPLFEMIK